VDVTELPRGSEVYLIERIEDDTKRMEHRLFRMRTLAKLRILPIEIERVEIFKTRGRTYRLLIELVAAHSRKDEVGEINLHVNHLDDLASSLMVMHAFKSHCRAVSVVFDA